MFDFFTHLWTSLLNFLLGVSEIVAHFVVNNPFMAGLASVYVVGFVIALIVFLPKRNA